MVGGNILHFCNLAFFSRFDGFHLHEKSPVYKKHRINLQRHISGSLRNIVKNVRVCGNINLDIMLNLVDLSFWIRMSDQLLDFGVSQFNGQYGFPLRVFRLLVIPAIHCENPYDLS